MNILIRDFDKCENHNNLYAIIEAFTRPELYNDLGTNKVKLTIKEFPQLTQPINVSKQGNGNLCFDFKVEEANNGKTIHSI